MRRGSSRRAPGKRCRKRAYRGCIPTPTQQAERERSSGVPPVFSAPAAPSAGSTRTRRRGSGAVRKTPRPAATQGASPRRRRSRSATRRATDASSPTLHIERKGRSRRASSPPPRAAPGARAFPGGRPARTQPGRTVIACPASRARAARSGQRGSPISRASTFMVPPGSGASAVRVARSPRAVSARVPSPPQQKTAAAPAAACSRARDSACPGPSVGVSRISRPAPARTLRIRRTRSGFPAPPALGFRTNPTRVPGARAPPSDRRPADRSPGSFGVPGSGARTGSGRGEAGRRRGQRSRTTSASWPSDRSSRRIRSASARVGYLPTRTRCTPASFGETRAGNPPSRSRSARAAAPLSAR